MGVWLSLVVGGESSSNRPLVRAVESLRSTAKQLTTDDDPDGGAIDLDIVFKVSGPIATGDFEGVEVRRWRPSKNELTVQVGVAEDGAGDDAKAFLSRTLQAVLDEARAHLARKQVDVPFDLAAGMVQQLIQSLDT